MTDTIRITDRIKVERYYPPPAEMERSQSNRLSVVEALLSTNNFKIFKIPVWGINLKSLNFFTNTQLIIQFTPKRKNLPYRTHIHHALRTIRKPCHHHNRIATGRAGESSARPRAGIKHSYLCSVEWNPEFGNIPRNACIGHDLELDRWGRDLLAVDRDGAGRGLRSGWRHKIRWGDDGWRG